MRLAALAIAKRSTDGVAGSEADVTAAYAQLPAVKRGGAPIATLATVGVLAAIGGGIAFAIVMRPGPAPRTWVKPQPLPTAAAYTTGGVPLHDAAIEKVLDGELTDLVIHVNRDLTGAERDLKTLRAESFHHGTAIDQAWQKALDAFKAAALVDERLLNPRVVDDLRESVRDFSEELNKAGFGYFLEGRIKGDHALIQAYRVEQVVFVVAGGKPRRVLSLRRLDHLNTAYAALGLYDEEVGDPTLHLERIDEYVATTELPAIAPGAPYPLAEDAFLATPEGKALAAATGDAVRADYTVALGADAAAASKIAALLAERATIIDQWRDHLEKKHIRFSSVDNLFVPEDLLKALDGIVPHYQHERVEAIDAELAELEAPRIHARVHDLVAATVRRHEAQHGFDFDRDTELRYPQELAAMLGPPHDDAGNEVAIVTSARAELAGYLSQVINDPLTPHAALGHLAAQTFTRDRAGTGEFYAGIVVLEGLAKQLGADATLLDTSRWHHGLDRERLAKLALVIARAPDAKLRDAAKALWQQLFGEPATVIVDSKTT
jgi:hypothetical protein